MGPGQNVYPGSQGEVRAKVDEWLDLHVGLGKTAVEVRRWHSMFIHQGARPLWGVGG